MTVESLGGGITRDSKAFEHVEWNILGQRYLHKADCDSTFAFETNSEPVVPEGELDLKLDGEWQTARSGDLVRMPRGVPHGYFNKSDRPARALFWASPARNLHDLFKVLHNMSDVEAVIRASAEHEVDFLPPEANN
nr:cupin domain-containing protein [Sinorhizobium kostiense]